MAVHIHIGTINVAPDVFASIVQDQLQAGADPATLEDIGYRAVPAQDEVIPPPTEDEEVTRYSSIAERYDQDAAAATARRNFLRNVVMHADKARGLEGFQTNHQRRPKNSRTLGAKEHSELVMATESLQSACGSCALSTTCRLSNDIDTWLDFHPYKRGPAGKRRPGSLLPPNVTEQRVSFLRALKQDPLAHCDPRKRPAVVQD